jgi:hypothetical protein
MSVITTATNPQVTNLNLIKSMCNARAWVFQENKTTYKWWGTDRKLETQPASRQNGKCNHAIAIPHTDYEIGVIDNQNGTYSFAYDTYSRPLADAVGGIEGTNLFHYYSLEHVKAQMQANQYTYEEHELEDKSVILIGERPKREFSTA